MSGRVLIMAGGTGGHVYPGLAVAAELRAAGCELRWMGTRHGLEARVVPAAGIPLALVPVSGLRRSGILRWLGAPFSVTRAVLCALLELLRHRPHVVLGMGGFVSGPGGLAAWLCRRPLVIHEQNALPGFTNRLLAPLAARVLEAFPGSFVPARRAVCTGNPVRAAIAALPAPAQRFATRRSARRVLVFGGSRGARVLNTVIPAALAASGVADLDVRHQCGADDVERTRANYAAGRFAAVEVTPYIEDMAAAYAQADLVIARAGATTVAELTACGAAAILVPYPYAVDDHQTANARYLAEQGAAVLLAESALAADTLGTTIAELLGTPTRLLDMAERARRLARPSAARDVARHCLEFAHGRS